MRHVGAADIVTDAMMPGAVQVPGDGIPIVMAVDCPTTGGYAKIGTVIGTELRLLAQARGGDGAVCPLPGRNGHHGVARGTRGVRGDRGIVL